jgi:hypothetical protein
LFTQLIAADDRRIMSESIEHELQTAISVLSQSDPIPKLLQEVRLGKMKATDPGLRAITETWLGTYQKVFEKGKAFDRQALMRLHPAPRVDVLITAGMVAADHPAVIGLMSAFEHRLASSDHSTTPFS